MITARRIVLLIDRLYELPPRPYIPNSYRRPQSVSDPP